MIEDMVPISETARPLKFYHEPVEGASFTAILTRCGMWTGSSMRRTDAERFLILCSKCAKKKP